MMAGTIGSLFHSNKPLTHTHSSSNISCTSHSRCRVARQVSFDRASCGSVAGVTKNLTLSTSSTLPLKKTPWLTLPLKDPMVNRFYSLEENRIIPIIKQYHENEMDDDPFCLGSSNGWLVHTNRGDCALFLYNPISHRIIKLPPVDTLGGRKPDYPFTFIRSLILSSSPDEEGCIAMCIYGFRHKLGFCRPGYDTTWIPLDENLEDYRQIAYSSKDKLFYGLNRSELDCWDLRDPFSPKRKLVAELEIKDHLRPLPAETYDELSWRYDSITTRYLLKEPWCDDYVLVIDRFIATPFFAGSPPKVTLFFEVYKVDFNNGVTKYLNHSLNDRALFVGRCQSFSLPARGSQHLRPNSIYFTNSYPTAGLSRDNILYGDYDVGNFNYEDKVLEPFNYPCGLKSMEPILVMRPSPVWFIPDLG